MGSYSVVKRTVPLISCLTVISVLVLVSSSTNILRTTTARHMLDGSTAGSPQVWKLTNTRLLIDWPNASVANGRGDALGGEIEVDVRGYGELCPGGTEHIRFRWQFNRDVTLMHPGEDFEARVEMKRISANNICKGELASRSVIQLVGSGSAHIAGGDYKQDERFLAKGGGTWAPSERAGLDPNGNAAITHMTVNTNANVSYPVSSFAVSIGGPCSTGYSCGFVYYLYQYQLSTTTDAGGGGAGGGAGVERNTNRAGGDYTSFNLAQPNYKLCQQACANDSRCAAWTYVRPGLQGATARCWLKSNVPGPSTNDCCVSGMKSSSGGGGGGLSLEYNTNRGGADYRNFDLAEARLELCRDACANDPQCKAFTYVKPGYQGPRARCWLKNSIPNGSSNACCISGVKR